MGTVGIGMYSSQGSSMACCIHFCKHMQNIDMLGKVSTKGRFFVYAENIPPFTSFT